MIHYKLIEHERIGDAPFTGALISAVDCNFGCRNCFNQNIKKLPTFQNSADNIVSEILKNKFNKGVIFAGLEWTLQYSEALELAKLAKEKGLKTMLYTGNDFSSLASYDKRYFDFIKCGTYQENKKTINHIECGVVLASCNQHIYQKGKDY